MRQVIRNTILGGKKSVAQKADEMGISESSLYRYGLDDDGSGSKMPAERLMSLMLVSKDFSILHHLAARLGFICLRIPRIPRSKRDDETDRQVFQKAFLHALEAIMKFHETPEPATKEAADKALYDMLTETASIRKKVEKWEQPELFD